MPWVKIGRFTFDMAVVELLTDGVEGADPSLTVGFISGRDIDLTGADALLFQAKFSEHVGSRRFARESPDVIHGGDYSANLPAGDSVGVEDGGGLGIHSASDH